MPLFGVFMFFLFCICHYLLMMAHILQITQWNLLWNSKLLHSWELLSSFFLIGHGLVFFKHFVIAYFNYLAPSNLLHKRFIISWILYIDIWFWWWNFVEQTIVNSTAFFLSDLYGINVRPVAPFGSASSKQFVDPALIHRVLPDELLFEVCLCGFQLISSVIFWSTCKYVASVGNALLR